MKNNNKDRIFEIKLKKILDQISFKKKLKNNISEGLDSMQIFNLISQIESQFKIKIKDEYVNEKNFKNLSTIIKIIEKIGNEKKKK